MRTVLAIAILGLFLAGPALQPALASETAAKSSKSTPGTSVEMPILVAPVVVDGRLTAYAYISATIVASSSSAAISIRDKTPFLQDAFIRDVNASPIGRKDAPDKVDSAALRTRLLADARRVMGDGKVSDFKVTRMEVTPLRSGATR